MNNAIRNFNLDVIDHYSDTCFQVTDKGRYGHLWMFWEKKEGVERTSGVGYQFLSEVTCQMEVTEKSKGNEEGVWHRVRTAAGDRTQARDQDVWRVCDIAGTSSSWFFPETNLDGQCKGLRERETSLLLGEFLHQGLEEM